MKKQSLAPNPAAYLAGLEGDTIDPKIVRRLVKEAAALNAQLGDPMDI